MVKHDELHTHTHTHSTRVREASFGIRSIIKGHFPKGKRKNQSYMLYPYYTESVPGYCIRRRPFRLHAESSTTIVNIDYVDIYPPLLRLSKYVCVCCARGSPDDMLFSFRGFLHCDQRSCLFKSLK